jgi:hypothetical protein
MTIAENQAVSFIDDSVPLFGNYQYIYVLEGYRSTAERGAQQSWVLDNPAKPLSGYDTQDPIVQPTVTPIAAVTAYGITTAGDVYQIGGGGGGGGGGEIGPSGPTGPSGPSGPTGPSGPGTFDYVILSDTEPTVDPDDPTKPFTVGREWLNTSLPPAGVQTLHVNLIGTTPILVTTNGEIPGVSRARYTAPSD